MLAEFLLNNYLNSASKSTSCFWTAACCHFSRNALRCFDLSIRMLFVRVLMHMRGDRLGISTLDLRLGYAGRTSRSDLLATVHARHLVHVVRKTEIAALLVSDDRRRYERMVRSAVIGVPSGVAHSD